MDEFEKFVSFLVVLLSALGFSVGNLLDLVTGAKQMTFFLDSNQIEVLTRTLLPSLMDTLVTFGGGVKAWMQSYSTELLGELVPISTRIKRASDRALELSKEKADDELGFVRTLPTPAKRAITALSLSPTPYTGSSSSSAAYSGRLATSGRSARSPTSNSGTSSSTGAHSRHSGNFAKSARGSPSDFSTSSAKKSKVDNSRGSMCYPKFFRRQCAIGEVIKWVGFYDFESLKAAWAVAYPTVPLRNSYIACLITKQHDPDAFLNFVPKGASDTDTQALRSWYDQRRGQDFVIDMPPDFR